MENVRGNKAEAGDVSGTGWPERAGLNSCYNDSQNAW